MASTGQSGNLQIITGIFSFDIGLLYLAGKTPLLVRDMLVIFGRHPSRNKQKCMLKYGWEFQPQMAACDQSVCSPLVESDSTNLIVHALAKPNLTLES